MEKRHYSLINYIMNIKYEDDFRYIINNENKRLNKKENEINIYNIKKTLNIPPIKIIDISIFNKENNIQFINKIEYIMNNNNINAICFVIKSNNDNINIINNILNLFGYDVIKNILFMFIDYNNIKPLIINKFEEKDSIFNLIINESNGYFKFNNSIILNDEKDENIKRIWEMNMNNFDKLIKKLINLPQINLNITREVIKIKKQILINLENLNEDFNEILLNKINLRDIIIDIELINNGIKNSKTLKIERIENHNNLRTKYCDRCNYECEKEIYQNFITNLLTPYCKKCPLKCHFREQ